MAKRGDAEILDAVRRLDPHDVKFCLDAARRIEDVAASDKYTALKSRAFLKLIDLLEML